MSCRKGPNLNSCCFVAFGTQWTVAIHQSPAPGCQVCRWWRQRWGSARILSSQKGVFPREINLQIHMDHYTFLGNSPPPLPLGLFKHFLLFGGGGGGGGGAVSQKRIMIHSYFRMHTRLHVVLVRDIKFSILSLNSDTFESLVFFSLVQLSFRHVA